MSKDVCILSGGMDSSAVAYILKKSMKRDLLCISFTYGQKHSNEIEYAKKIAQALDVEHQIINLDFGKYFLLQSSLTSKDKDVPEGEYTVENMKSTVVPNRNAIMLSIAWGIACNLNSQFLGCGVHAGDDMVYPDCRLEFINCFDKALKLATKGINDDSLELFTPFLLKPKSECVRIGTELGLDFKNTWTCYNGGEKHCGKCGACYSRKVAFTEAGVLDLTEYMND